ncbi:MAG: hypothetical protein EBT92_19840, partial [Planctomycetes bacterium]|nr:hypothetical protein [Planctomycetota bacterium]
PAPRRALGWDLVFGGADGPPRGVGRPREGAAFGVDVKAQVRLAAQRACDETAGGAGVDGKPVDDDGLLGRNCDVMASPVYCPHALGGTHVDSAGTPLGSRGGPAGRNDGAHRRVRQQVADKDCSEGRVSLGLRRGAINEVRAKGALEGPRHIGECVERPRRVGELGDLPRRGEDYAEFILARCRRIDQIAPDFYHMDNGGPAQGRLADGQGRLADGQGRLADGQGGLACVRQVGVAAAHHRWCLRVRLYDLTPKGRSIRGSQREIGDSESFRGLPARGDRNITVAG